MRWYQASRPGEREAFAPAAERAARSRRSADAAAALVDTAGIEALRSVPMTNDAQSPAPQVTVQDPDATLRARRSAASLESGGISNETVYAAIERALASIGPAGDLMDFGAGTGQFTIRLRDSGRYRSVTGADLFPRGDAVPPDIRWVQGDLNERLPLGDGSFDLIVAAEVIEHLENPRAMCREIFRLLRPGGRFVVSTPNNES